MREGKQCDADLFRKIKKTNTFKASAQDCIIQKISMSEPNTVNACNADNTSCMVKISNKSDRNETCKKGKILLMDDNVNILEVLSKILINLGYAVVFVREGNAAIEKYTIAKSEGYPFDLCIIDLTIKGGRGGKSTMEELLKIDPQVKAIISSGYSNDPLILEYRKFGFIDYLLKPYKIDEFIAKIREHLQ